jgi:hypothetical protein
MSERIVIYGLIATAFAWWHGDNIHALAERLIFVVAVAELLRFLTRFCLQRLGHSS